MDTGTSSRKHFYSHFDRRISSKSEYSNEADSERNSVDPFFTGRIEKFKKLSSEINLDPFVSLGLFIKRLILQILNTIGANY